jgi:hypothetical protein
MASGGEAPIHRCADDGRHLPICREKLEPINEEDVAHSLNDGLSNVLFHI